MRELIVRRTLVEFRITVPQHDDAGMDVKRCLFFCFLLSKQKRQENIEEYE